MHIIEGNDSVAMLRIVILVLIVSLTPLLGAYIAMTGDIQSATGIGPIVLAVSAALWVCMQVEIGRNT